MPRAGIPQPRRDRRRFRAHAEQDRHALGRERRVLLQQRLLRPGRGAAGRAGAVAGRVERFLLPSDRTNRIFADQNSAKILSEFRKIHQEFSEIF